MLVNTCKLAKVSSFFENDAINVTFVRMKLDSKTLWNEAGRVGFVFGGFSSLCLVLKEGAALTGSTFLVQAAAIILWAVEFFGCILLMKKYMLDLRDKFDGVTVEDTYRFGRRVALLSGLILAAVDAVLIMKMPQETVESVITELNTAISTKMGGGLRRRDRPVRGQASAVHLHRSVDLLLPVRQPPVRDHVPLPLHAGRLPGPGRQRRRREHRQSMTCYGYFCHRTPL